MTIIAVDVRAGVMVADTLVLMEGAVSHHTHKIVRLPDGSLAGAAGDGDQCLGFLRWAGKGFKGKDPNISSCTGLHLTEDRRLRVFLSSAAPEDALEAVLAIGAGKEAFYAAFRAGADIAASVRIACEVNRWCGLPITTLTLEADA